MSRVASHVVAVLSFCLIATLPICSFGAGIPSPPTRLNIGASPPADTTPPPPVSPPGNEGLLSGMTPSNYKIPSGWVLVREQDFEGTKPNGETWGSWNGSVTSTRAHSGSMAIEGTYANDQADAHWTVNQETVGPYTEVYLSFYEYLDSGARFNDEFFLADFFQSGVNKNVIVDWFWAGDSAGAAYNGTYAQLSAVNEQGPPDYTQYMGWKEIPRGAWIQWEVHFRPASSSGAKDGFLRVYKNGVLFAQSNGRSFCTDLKSGSAVQAGGVYTLLSWSTNYPTCTDAGSKIGSGTDACTFSMKWSGQSFSSPHLHPPLSSFNRYLDDIIVMKR